MHIRLGINYLSEWSISSDSNPFVFQDSVNRMNAHNLALIFGPCLMRRKESVHAQDQLQDVNRLIYIYILFIYVDSDMGEQDMTLFEYPFSILRPSILFYSRQAICVAALVEEKLRQYRETLNNIVELEGATEKVYCI